MKCLVCADHIHPYEVYTDFYYCEKCDKTYGFHNDEDHHEDMLDMISHLRNVNNSAECAKKNHISLV